MCDYFSGIVTKKGEVLWLRENPVNHEAIIQAYKLKDTELDGREWVRFELKPNLTELFKIGTWKELQTKLREVFTHRWDEERTLPSWVEKDCAKIIASCYRALEESVLLHLVPANELLQELKDKGYVHLMWGNAQIKSVSGNAQIKSVSGNAQILKIENFATVIKNDVIYVAKGTKVKHVNCLADEERKRL